MEAFNQERPYRLSDRALRLFESLRASGERSSCSLAKNIAGLSSLFTRERQELGARYLDDPALGAGYAAYFLPVNFAKVQVLLNELPSDWVHHSSISVLDVGAGPGTASLAVLDWLVSQGRIDQSPLHVTAIDHSKAALREAVRAWKAYGTETLSGCATLATMADRIEHVIDADARTRVLAQGPFDLIVVANCLNELYCGSSDREAQRARLLECLLGLLKPDGTLMIIEPALRSTARELHRTRDLVLERGLCTVYSPCLHDHPCPALIKADDWCHEERPWQPPSWITELDQELGFIKDALKFSYLLLRKDGRVIAARSPDVFRVVSELRVLKGEKRAWLCNELGRSEVGRLDRKAAVSNVALDAWRRGDIVQIDRIARKDRGGTISKLGRIGEDSVVKFVRET